jgi:hypothetical protein
MAWRGLANSLMLLGVALCAGAANEPDERAGAGALCGPTDDQRGPSRSSRRPTQTVIVPNPKLAPRFSRATLPEQSSAIE